MASQLDLSLDELLSTTRAVRKRLDLSRPVPDDLIRECVALAMQAPAGSNIPRTRFVVLRERENIEAMAALYREVFQQMYQTSDSYVRKAGKDVPKTADRQERVADSVDFLAEHIRDAPALVIAVLAGMRIEGDLAHMGPTFFGQTCPAMWNFMLAARARGLGTCWTTMHLFREREAAALLGIPYDLVQQVCLTPLAYTIGTDFRPAKREDPDSYIHWERWNPDKNVPAPWAGLATPTPTDADDPT